jgi:hypothetical protein
VPPETNSAIANAAASAEHELGAFLRAVEMSGIDPQRQAADLWLQALEDTPCREVKPESFFRELSIRVAAQLAASRSTLENSWA